MGTSHMVSPVHNNLAVFFFFIVLLSMTLWYTLICRAQTESKNVKCESISYWKQIYPWRMNHLSRLQIVNVRFMNIQQVQAACTQASHVSHKVMQSWVSVPRYPLNVDGIFQFAIILWIHLNLYHITHGNSDCFYVTTAKHKIIQMKHMLYRCVWSHCGNDGSLITLPCSTV